MDDTEFQQFLEQKYAQIVLKVFLDAKNNSCTFTTLRDEVNAIIADDSRGAKETTQEGEYSPASLSSILSEAKDAGIVTRYLNDDGEKRWQLRRSQLSSSQIDEIYSKNSSNTQHTDTSSLDIYKTSHTDSRFS